MKTILNLPFEFWLFQILIILVPILFCYAIFNKKLRTKVKRKMMNEVIEYEKTHLIGQLSTSIAHELKTPMENARNLLESLSQSKEIPLQDKNKITESVYELERVCKILHDYLRFADAPDSEDTLLDVHEEINSVIGSLYSFTCLYNNEIKFLSTLNENYYVKGNKFQFRQALINIIKNGMEACQNGKIEIAVHEMLSSILIVIEDNGHGMSKEQMNSIGDPLRTTKKKGTGLGIMVSYRIINSMNGKIEVESEKGKGTIFSIILPKVNSVQGNRVNIKSNIGEKLS